MSFSFDHAKRLLGLLRERTDGMAVEFEGGERMGMVPEDERYQIEMLTEGYEVPAAVLGVLHRTGPFALRHLGAVREEDARHVWLLKPEG